MPRVRRGRRDLLGLPSSSTCAPDRSVPNPASRRSTSSALRAFRRRAAGPPLARRRSWRCTPHTRSTTTCWAPEQTQIRYRTTVGRLNSSTVAWILSWLRPTLSALRPRLLRGIRHRFVGGDDYATFCRKGARDRTAVDEEIARSVTEPARLDGSRPRAHRLVDAAPGRPSLALAPALVGPHDPLVEPGPATPSSAPRTASRRSPGRGAGRAAGDVRGRHRAGPGPQWRASGRPLAAMARPSAAGW